MNWRQAARAVIAFLFALWIGWAVVDHAVNSIHHPAGATGDPFPGGAP